MLQRGSDSLSQQWVYDTNNTTKRYVRRISSWVAFNYYALLVSSFVTMGASGVVKGRVERPYVRSLALDIQIEGYAQ